MPAYPQDHVQQITRYFRQSVLDAERLSPDRSALYEAVKERHRVINKNKPFSLDATVWQQGVMPVPLATAVFTAAKVDKKVNEVALLFMPRVDLCQVFHGQFIGQQSAIITPLVVAVWLNRKGVLRPSTTPPYVPREWLAPNQSDHMTFAQTAVLDAFMTLNPFNVTTWEALQHYCGKLLTALLTDEADIRDEQDYGDALWQHTIHKDYQLKPTLSLASLEQRITAGWHIQKVLDAILHGAQPSALYQQLIKATDEPKSDYRDLTRSLTHAKQHIAQMTGAFPLADKQRNSLHYLMDLADGHMLAINGPPGTGKTTLLCSVVANEWVKAALAGNNSEPPIIVATSSNNQAITNILDSFYQTQASQLEPALKGRWLPGLDTYGLYACGSNKANAQNPYAYVTKDGDGIMAQLQDEDYLRKARAYFLQAFNRWAGSSDEQESVTNIPIAIATRVLLTALQRCVQLQTAILVNYTDRQQAIDQCQQQYGGERQLQHLIAEKTEQQQALREQRVALDGLLDPFLHQWRHRPIWQQLLAFLPWIKKRWQLDNELLARKLQLTCQQTTDQGIRQAIHDSLADLDQQLRFITQQLDQALAAHEQLQALAAKGKQLLAQAGITERQPMNLAAILQAFDTGLRLKAFQLATHYWEARWLQAMTCPLAPSQCRSPNQRQLLHQQYAKLTPCMVATFNMLPNFFSVSEYGGDGWRTLPLADGIDLLIVDEAGQALPPMAAASFAVAKKALLVGDIHQIEPVCSLPAGIDRANLASLGLLTSSLTYDGFWLPSSLLASSGNLMKVAHRQVQEHQVKALEPGLYLTEHRRCYDSIISYCNRLVYKGHLQPLRGDPEHDDSLLPMMGFIHHNSTSVRRGSSRINFQEAVVIANWLLAHQAKLAGNNPLGTVVAVITPFALQARVIRSELVKQQLASVKVGTVHTFQGAECPVVLFSSVYGSNDQASGKFYDRSRNMLNVAVSRAKDSFIVFGHEAVFGNGSPSSPSALLKAFCRQPVEDVLV